MTHIESLYASQKPARLGSSTAQRDEMLIIRIAQGHSSALAELYDHYARLIFSIALRITGDRETAEEVTQDVFYDVWRSAGSFSAASGYGASWLMSITRHRAIDTTRSRRYRARSHESSMGFEQPAGVEHDPQQLVQNLMTRELVRNALAQLPQDQRQALELAYYGGLSAGRIATQLSIPIGTIKTRLRLGLQKLHDRLAAYRIDLL